MTRRPAPTPEELAAALAKVHELLEALNTEVAVMPSFRRGTKWHTDHMAARQRLLAQRDRLRAESPP